MKETCESVTYRDMNPVINSVLCYVSTARHSLRNDDIVRACLVFYKVDDIIKAKDLLFETVGEKSIRRRNGNHMMKELQDILDLLKKCDDSGTQLPVFVTDAYDGLPPSSGFEMVAESVMSLIDEISNLRKEIEFLKENRTAQTVNNKDNAILQEDVLVIKGELRKLNLRFMNDDVRRNSLMLSTLEKSITVVEGKGANGDGICDRAMESDIISNGHGQIIEDNVNDDSSLSPSAPPASQESWGMMNRLMFDVGGPPSAPSFAAVTRGEESVIQDGGLASPRRLRSSMQFNAASDIARPIAGQTQNQLVRSERKIDNGKADKDDFVLVQNRRRKKNIVDSKKSSGSDTLKSAIRLADLYIGNCDANVSTESLSQYIYSEMNMKVEKCESLLSKNVNYKSFKVTLNLNDRLKLLSPDVWPEGIICRKFYSPRNNSNS